MQCTLLKIWYLYGALPYHRLNTLLATMPLETEPGYPTSNNTYLYHLPQSSIYFSKIANACILTKGTRERRPGLLCNSSISTISGKWQRRLPRWAPSTSAQWRSALHQVLLTLNRPHCPVSLWCVRPLTLGVEGVLWLGCEGSKWGSSRVLVCVYEAVYTVVFHERVFGFVIVSCHLWGVDK